MKNQNNPQSSVTAPEVVLSFLQVDGTYKECGRLFLDQHDQICFEGFGDEPMKNPLPNIRKYGVPVSRDPDLQRGCPRVFPDEGLRCLLLIPNAFAGMYDRAEVRFKSAHGDMAG